MAAVALALAWPWAVLKVLGLGLMTCGLINITDKDEVMQVWRLDGCETEVSRLCC